MTSNWRGMRLATTVLVMVISLTMLTWAMGTVAASPAGGCATLRVPSQYPTIQGAINAAHPCDTILVAPGTYIGQLTIDKSINLVGSGAWSTIVQGPAVVTPDAFGSPWMIELGAGATVSITGVTVLVTLQCIIGPGPSGVLYAGGGIGVGGSAYLNLQSAVVTTTGGTEGAACGGPSPTTSGTLSYGDGIAFGLDYVVGSPSASALIGSGQVTGVTVSGFGYSGEAIGIGGHVDSAAGSSATISYDKLTISSDATGDYSLLDVGGSLEPCSATIVHSVLMSSPEVTPNDITVAGGSSVYVAYNSILAGWAGIGVAVAGSSATILYNSIIGPTSTFGETGVGVFEGGTATVSYNTIGQFECAYDPALLEAGVCGPNYLTQYQLAGIWLDGSGTVAATNNLIYATDAGFLMVDGCSPNCVVQNNVITNSYDYGLAGIDGSYSIGPNLIIGGAYGVAAIAYSVDTAVTLSHVVMVGPTVAPFYYEVDFTGGTATITGTWTILP